MVTCLELPIADCRLTAEQFATPLFQSTIGNHQSAITARSRSGRDSLRNAPETAMTGTELADCGLKVGGFKVRPHPVREDEFRVSALPQHEVAQAMLTAGANQKVKIGDRRPVVIDPGEQARKLGRRGCFGVAQGSRGPENGVEPNNQSPGAGTTAGPPALRLRQLQ